LVADNDCVEGADAGAFMSVAFSCQPSECGLICLLGIDQDERRNEGWNPRVQRQGSSLFIAPKLWFLLRCGELLSPGE
jgi:hypothetical protein